MRTDQSLFCFCFTVLYIYIYIYHIRVPCVAYLNLIHCHQWLCVNMHINANTALGKSFKWSKVTGKAYYCLISHNQKHLYHLFLFYMTLCCSRLDIFISFIWLQGSSSHHSRVKATFRHSNRTLSVNPFLIYSVFSAHDTQTETHINDNWILDF